MCGLFLVIAFTSSLPAYQDADLASSYYHFSRAQLHRFERNFSLAAEELEKAVGLDPQSAALRLEYADLLMMAGNSSQALQECRNAIEIDPHFSRAHLMLGQMYYRARQMDEALQSFEQANRLNPGEYEGFYYAGSLYMEEREWEKAAQAFSEVIRLRPDALRAYTLKAEALSQLNRIEESIQLLESVVQLRSGDFQLLDLLGKLYERTGQNDKAIETYQSIQFEGLASSAEKGAVDRQLAQLFCAAQRYQEALPLLQKLTNDNPHELLLHSLLGLSLTELKLYDQAVDHLRRLIGTLNQDQGNRFRMEAMYHLGRALEGRGDRGQAIQQFEELIESTQESNSQSSAWYNRAASVRLALLHQRTRQYQKAIDLFDAVRLQEPDEPWHIVRLAFAFTQAGRHDDALEMAARLAEGWPGDKDLEAVRARIFFEAEESKQALDLLEQLLEAHPEDESVYLSASQLFVEHEKYRKAEETIQDGLSRFPKSESLLFQYAALLERRKEFQKAEAEFRKLLARNPDHHSAMNYLGYMLADLDIKLEEALGHIQKAVDADPFNGAYLDSLGWVLFRMGKLELAEDYLKQASRLNDDDPTIFEHLGDLYSRLEEFEQARKNYQASLKFATEEEERERAEKKLRELDGTMRPESQ